MGQVVFGDLSVCTEPASSCLSATCVFLYSSCPVGLEWLICQAVCCHWGSIPVVQGWLICQAVPLAIFFFFFFAPCWSSCEQLNRLSGGLYVTFHNKDDKCYIFSMFSLFFISFSLAPFFYCLDFSLLFLALSPAISVSESLISFWLKELHAELWFDSDVVASAATCQRNLSRGIVLSGEEGLWKCTSKVGKVFEKSCRWSEGEGKLGVGQWVQRKSRWWAETWSVSAYCLARWKPMHRLSIVEGSEDALQV